MEIILKTLINASWIVAASTRCTNLQPTSGTINGDLLLKLLNFVLLFFQFSHSRKSWVGHMTRFDCRHHLNNRSIQWLHNKGRKIEMKLNKRKHLLLQFSNIFVRKNVDVLMISYLYVSKKWFSREWMVFFIKGKFACFSNNYWQRNQSLVNLTKSVEW